MNSRNLYIVYLLIFSHLPIVASNEPFDDVHREVINYLNLGIGLIGGGDPQKRYYNIVTIFHEHGIKSNEAKAEILIDIFENRHLHEQPSELGSSVISIFRFLETPAASELIEEVLTTVDPDGPDRGMLLSALTAYMKNLKIPVDSFLREQMQFSPIFKKEIMLRRMFYYYLREYMKSTDDRQGWAAVEAVYRDLVLEEEDEDVFLIVDGGFSEISANYKYSRERYEKIKEFLAREDRKPGWADSWNRLEQAEQELRPRFSE